MRKGSPVEGLFQGTFMAVLTGITDVGRLREPGAWIRDIGDAGLSAFAAGPAEPVMQGSAAGADVPEGTFPVDIEQAVIEGPAHRAGFFFGDVFADLFGDGGAVLAKDQADLLEGRSFIEFCLDESSGFQV